MQEAQAGRACAQYALGLRYLSGDEEDGILKAQTLVRPDDADRVILHLAAYGHDEEAVQKMIKVAKTLAISKENAHK
jgi:hypothetical protein